MNHESARTMMAVLMGLSVCGCRTATRTAAYPRVDLDVSPTSGNRGYLIGTPPPAPELKQQRQMIETDVELPSFYHSTKGTTEPVSLGEPAAPETEMSAAATGTPSTAAVYDTYTVKTGDTLSSIAAKPAVYGNGNKWRKLYNANREVIKTPNRLRAGMILKIPRGTSTASTTTTEGSGTTFTK